MQLQKPGLPYLGLPNKFFNNYLNQDKCMPACNFGFSLRFPR